MSLDSAARRSQLLTSSARLRDQICGAVHPDPTLTYKLWLRLKAEANNWANDSVFVQFDVGVDASGTPVYQIGSTSALSVNLEECVNCGVSGWSWRDDASGAKGTRQRRPAPLLQAAKKIETSPFLAEKIILSVHTGLRRGSLFHLRWDHVDFLNRVLRIQRTKSGRPHALPLNATGLTTLQALYNQRIPDCPYAFPHATGRKAGEPVQDVKNAFHTALETAGIKDFTWHDLRHTFASWLIMKGASLRSVAELLGHRGLRMVMRYAHLSREHLTAEVGLLDSTPLRPRRPDARKGQEKGNVL